MCVKQYLELNHPKKQNVLTTFGQLCGTLFIPGEWLLLIVYLAKDYLREKFQVAQPNTNGTLNYDTDILTSIGLQNLPLFTLFAVAVSFVTFWGIGLSFDQYFYKNRKHIVSKKQKQ